MISLIHGQVRWRSPLIGAQQGTPHQLVLEAQGVGYELLCTLEAYEAAPADGEEFELFTRLIVREDSMTLFGFLRLEERSLFDQVIAVSGIGPKTGLAMVSALGSSTLREAIRSSDVGRLTAIPGIGKKTAERLVVELRDKLLKEELFEVGTPRTAPEAVSTGETGAGVMVRTDALAALLALGYPRAVAEKAIRTVLRDDPEAAKTTQTLVKAALRESRD